MQPLSIIKRGFLMLLYKFPDVYIWMDKSNKNNKTYKNILFESYPPMTPMNHINT